MHVLIGLPVVQLGDHGLAIHEHLVFAPAVSGRQTEHTLEPTRAGLYVSQRDQRLRSDHGEVTTRRNGAE
jgi:hypothetical protein